MTAWRTNAGPSSRPPELIGVVVRDRPEVERFLAVRGRLSTLAPADARDELTRLGFEVSVEDGP